MSCYYCDKLSAEQLRRCYEIAPPRIQQYLEAEINHVLHHINPGDMVLDLGCGYGRILPSLAQKARAVIGIDISFSSLLLGKKTVLNIANCHLLNMDAVLFAFPDRIFDIVVCIQNGISAFHVDQQDLIRESIRVTKPGGTILFSSYSDKFWNVRLEWFQLQSEAGLLGEIDYNKTCEGVIVCKDGFRATTVKRHQFLALTEKLNADIKIQEVDESSLFCEIIPR
ncbi:TPA: class I SAM-dependent methyltransferase [Candidatus Bathyarchaeota archaeon]|nr:class I SAM-dependent methyltransferase [Candidatus Bathyarchaeota archaeon]